MKMEAVGKLKIVATRLIPKANDHVVFWETTFEDETGKRFAVVKSCWSIELKSEVDDETKI